MNLPSGAKLFFPNITFKLVRSSLPPHQAVFRVPPAMNKLDMKSLLTSLYGIEVLDVRTMNYLGRRHRDRKGQHTTSAAFKKVIVTMKDDFIFPDPKTSLAGSEMTQVVIPNRAPSRKFQHLMPVRDELNMEEQ
ncbi:hypothetical protein HDU97_004650 [Phlyctochytrium planicorne]|nr:hypothetical protein HDU97_004650 [Phlyctochytrium planicorne]